MVSKRAMLLATSVFLAVGICMAQSVRADGDSTSVCELGDGWQQVQAPERSSGLGVRNEGLNLAISEAWLPRGRLYAVGIYGLYASDDCGSQWSQLYGSPPPYASALYVQSVAADPVGRVVMSHMLPNDASFGVSNDDGVTWEWMLPRFGAVLQGGLSVSPAGRLYARSSGATSRGGANAFGFADDGGKTWTVFWHQTKPVRFAADPLYKEIVYSVDELRSSEALGREYSILRSMDSGATFHPWSQVQELPGALAVSVDGSRFWFASYGQHLWQSRDAGQSWHIMEAMPFTDPKQLAVSPHDPRVLYAVSGDGNIWVYREPDAAPAQVPPVGE